MVEFYNSFNNYDVYMVFDDNKEDYISLIKETHPHLNNIIFIQMDEKKCHEAGIKYLNSLLHNGTIHNTRGFGWEKGIYSFTISNTNYNHVWLLEEDVFIFDESTLVNIDEKYGDKDILCNSSYGEGKLNEWLWKYISIPFNPPYYCGMMCACRLSKKYLQIIKEYASYNKKLFFLEAFFPTLAKCSNLDVVPNPSELLTITAISKFNYDKFNKTDLFHPCKDVKEHTFLRHYLNNK
jgi:hypothetical protein